MTQTMTQTVSTDSNSLILRSSHILLVEVIESNRGEWTSAQPGLKSRKVDLSLRIADTLRGKLNPPPIGPVQIQITQYDYTGELMMQPVPGAWSGLGLKPGTELVAFARTKESRAERVLVDPACTQVVPAEPVLPGLRIAGRAEKGALSLDSTLTLADAEATRLDPLFADFLWSKFGGAAMASQSEFNLLEEFTERRGIEVATRQELLKDAYDFVGLYGDSTPERAQRLALAMFRVLLMPEAADLRENLISTYLPNLLGITSALPHQPAPTVFKNHEAERSAVKSFLQRQTDADAVPLLTWLNAR